MSVNWLNLKGPSFYSISFTACFLLAYWLSGLALARFLPLYLTLWPRYEFMDVFSKFSLNALFCLFLSQNNLKCSNCVCLSICLFVCFHDNSKSNEQIFVGKLEGKEGVITFWKNPDPILDTKYKS